MEYVFKEKLANYCKHIEDGIETLLPAPDSRPQKLHAAMRYSIQAGGKRIRPMLLLTASHLFPSRPDPLAAAVALECMHTYTLIHDDLPSMDNSDLRRGRPSCHKQFGEATAILAGDALLTVAFQLLAKHYAIQPELSVSLTHDLASAGNSEHLIGGQMEDIENEGKPVDAQTLCYIHKNKTCALIQAALMMGLRFSGPNEDQIKQIQLIGYHIGMAFQIIDDILNETSNVETLGKPVGNDNNADKSTYTALHGITSAQTEAEKHTAAALKTTKTLGGNNRFLLDLIDQLGKRIA